MTTGGALMVIADGDEVVVDGGVLLGVALWE